MKAEIVSAIELERPSKNKRRKKLQNNLLKPFLSKIFALRPCFSPPPLTTKSPTTHYQQTISQIVPRDIL